VTVFVGQTTCIQQK